MNEAVRTPGHAPPAFSNAAHVLLLSRLSLGLLLGPLLPDTAQSRVAPGLPQGSVGTTLDRGGKVALLDLGNGVGQRVDGEGGAEFGNSGAEILGLSALAGEDDQALLVGLKTGDIGGEGLLAEVLTAVVDGDTDGGGVETRDAGLLWKARDV